MQPAVYKVLCVPDLADPLEYLPEEPVMPRTTEYFGATVTNLGPLTTTYSAPSSCATGFRAWGVARNVSYTGGMIGQYQGQAGSLCEQQSISDCIPSGTKMDELMASAAATTTNDYLPYYSPGLNCPAGWETVGVATGSGRPTSGAGLYETPKGAKGVFTEDPWPYPPSRTQPVPLPLVKQYMAILEDTETIVLCCPRYVSHTRYEKFEEGKVNG